MKSMFLVIAAVILLITLPLNVIPQTDEFFSGKAWIGIVKEKGYGLYPVHMSINRVVKDGFSGTIQYPSLKCGGVLRFEGVDKDAYIFTERIQWGKDKCYDGGKVSVARSADDSLVWLWFYPDGRLNVEGQVYVLK
jgi:hypothetical protein